MSLPRSAFQTRKPPRAGRPSWKVAEEYKRWLRKLACAKCEQHGTEFNPIVAAHVDHEGSKGLSTKAADSACMPLCNNCHRDQHQVGWLTFEQGLRGRDAVVMAAVYWTEWPGRAQWERDQTEAAGVRAAR